MENTNIWKGLKTSKTILYTEPTEEDIIWLKEQPHYSEHLLKAVIDMLAEAGGSMQDAYQNCLDGFAPCEVVVNKMFPGYCKKGEAFFAPPDDNHGNYYGDTQTFGGR